MADIELVRLCRSANHPTDDVSVAGGALASGPIEIDDSTVGEWLPKLLTPATGDLDVDAVTQYQVAYLRNGDTLESADNPRIYLANALEQLANPSFLEIVSDNPGDDSTRHVRIWGEVAGVLVYEDLPLAGTSVATSAHAFTRVFRIQLRSNSDGQPVPAVGNIDVEAVLDSAVIGRFLAPEVGFMGHHTLSAEYAFGVPAAKGDVGTWADRRTAPAGISFASYRSPSQALYLPDDLLPEEHCAVYVRQTIQPGMPRLNFPLDFCFEIE